MKAEYVDHMGDDLRVVNAARVSLNKESDWDVARTYLGHGDMTDAERVLSEKDIKLVKYLSDHGHWTPFSHCIVSMRETVPIFVARQRFKHFIGFTYREQEEDGLEASYNEVSRRYVKDDPEFWYPEYWRKAPDKGIKQGSVDEPIDDIQVPYYNMEFGYEDILDLCEQWYIRNIANGMAPEMARAILPQAMYTSYYVTGSLAAWGRAYNLRKDPHAQKEIRDLAAQWDKIIAPLFPESWKALTDG